MTITAKHQILISRRRNRRHHRRGAPAAQGLHRRRGHRAVEHALLPAAVDPRRWRTGRRRRRPSAPNPRCMPKRAHAGSARRAAAFDPEDNTVTCADGATYAYDVLVVCPGIQLDWNRTEGLEDALGKDGVSSNYRFDLAPRTWDFIRNTTIGHRGVHDAFRRRSSAPARRRRSPTWQPITGEGRSCSTTSTSISSCRRRGCSASRRSPTTWTRSSPTTASQCTPTPR